MMLHTFCESPFGDLLLVGDGQVVRAIHLPREGQRKDPGPGSVEDVSAFADARREFGEYFVGSRETFGFAREQGGTPFQLRVWAELARIPYGATITYGELARRIGRPKAFRAVGTANGRNALRRAGDQAHPARPGAARVGFALPRGSPGVAWSAPLRRPAPRCEIPRRSGRRFRPSFQKAHSRLPR
jgi:O6-methylguanine-DNA--protein-cysteine methyltransferase